MRGATVYNVSAHKVRSFVLRAHKEECDRNSDIDSIEMGVNSSLFLKAQRCDFDCADHSYSVSQSGRTIMRITIVVPDEGTCSRRRIEAAIDSIRMR
jgi:hypothetical protein